MTDLATLRSAVDSILIRDDIGAAVTDFRRHLRIAEAEITRVVRPATLHRLITLPMTAPSIDLPADFLEIVSLGVADNQPEMDYVTPDVFVRRSPQHDRSGQFYTIVGGGGVPSTDERMRLLVSGAPSPTTPTNVDLLYMARFPQLVNDTDTNWILLNHFDLFLYAVLRAAAEWIEEDELEAKYQNRFDRITRQMGINENRKRYAALGHVAFNSPRTIV